MRYIATVHVHIDVEAETVEQARDIVRNRILGAGMRFSLSGPGHAVNGIRLDVPLGERVQTAQREDATVREHNYSDENVQVEGLEIGGLTGGTVKIGGKRVYPEADPDSGSLSEDEERERSDRPH
jgi:hypothetical protein